MNYKLICIDLDGTLLDNKCEISERNKKALKAVENKSIKIAFTTGRLFTSAKLHARKAEVKVSIIASNGAYIRELRDEKPIYQCPLSYDQFHKVCNIIEKYNLDVNFNSFDRVITEYELPQSNNHVIANTTVTEDLKIKFGVHKNIREIYDIYKEGIFKVLLFSKRGIDTIKEAKRELLYLGNLEVVSSAHDNIEVMASGISKGRGIELLAQTLGITKKEILCIGDSENDISMFNNSGFKIAMGNAIEELKAMADYITDSNINSGVAKALERILNNI
ncbi:Cof-type HAD-IIB family hydrolase [Desnuesiella massiliensis]|uniref:Cof-type HAD-IIB family hydrolase n=1 Tax=Desnuesiella massiliensis TaxID=1650662 RepID=UPI0006E1C31F|nr:Cof-type HAD-IIB family hydrolase [Desnuesiella massiliensis]